MNMECNCPSVTPISPSLTSICSGSQLVFFMMILDKFLERHCDITDPCNRFQPRRYFNSRYDFVVVGGGSAGATIAGRLAALDFSVILLEAGLEEPAANQIPSFYRNLRRTELDWQYTTEPESTACLNQDGQRCYLPRGKVLGGTGAINGLAYLRGSKKDFDNWARLGNPGWSYDEVLPFFLRSTTRGPLQVSRYSTPPLFTQAIIDAGRELGYSNVNSSGRNQAGFTLGQATIKNGHRMSTARAFLRPLRDLPNLHVMLNSTVARIIFDNDKRATGVEFYYNDGLYEVAASNEVIISAGSLNSPQILLNSGIGPREHLASVGIPTVHHLPGVGENFQDHVAISLNISINENEKSIFNLNTFTEYLRTETGPFSQSGLNQIVAMINTKYADATGDNPDIQLIFSGYEATCNKITISEQTTGNNISFLVSPTLLRPKSRGVIRLRDNNPFSKPLIYAKYLTHPDDVKILIEGVKFAVQIAETRTMKKYNAVLNRTPVKGCENFSFGTDSYWMCAVKRQSGSNNHQVGTCKMGPRSDPLSVVDNQLRVHGVKRLRVADASIMPLITSANTMATTIMIGEKAAEFLRLMYKYRIYLN